MELNCVQTMSKSKVYVHDTTLRPQNAEQLRENGERAVVEILYCTSISHGAQLLYVRTTGCPTRLRSHYFSGGGTTTWLSVFLFFSGGSTTWLSVGLFFSGGFTTTASQFDTTTDTHNYTRIQYFTGINSMATSMRRCSHMTSTHHHRGTWLKCINGVRHTSCMAWLAHRGPRDHAHMCV